MDRGALWATGHGIVESDRTKQLPLSLFLLCRSQLFPYNEGLVYQSILSLTRVREFIDPGDRGVQRLNLPQDLSKYGQNSL